MEDVFLALVRAGLWGDVNGNDLPALQACDLSGANLNENLFRGLDWEGVQKMAEEQSVLGLVAGGAEKLPTGILPLTEKLTLLGKCQLIEQRNVAMSRFTEALVKKLQDAGINVMLVKGQGIAQCYARPLWRASGDIDLFFSKEDYPKGIELLSPLASKKVQDARYTKSYGLTIDGWFIELHGTLRNSLSSKMDKVIDVVQKDTFDNGKVRICRIGEADVMMPCANNDLFLVFAHFVRHFYKGGFSLRQLCDWCRLMWTYKDKIDVNVLEKRLRKAGIMTEWKAFAAVAVDYLGMPQEAVPLYDDSAKWHQKAEKILNHMFNPKNNKLSPAKVFPVNTIKFLPALLMNVNSLKVKERLLA